ncbi:MAG: mechanosensitive ion channel [Bacteroidales bacterium]|nr:mechanosensitive ion channel [Bacteroidales bacterium]MDD3299220.1 mechanosensitive ion channel [Bacteroidales bacterium]MDD3843690.1 mechanosensitive ion channel [Bacteroidales bacterium]MDD4618123.1 mechanosensitive ion channel [Bacteroidales bacterium]
MLLLTSYLQVDSLSTEQIAEKLSTISSMPANELLASIWALVVPFAMNVLLAVVIYVAGAWLIKKAKRLTRLVMEKKEIDPSLRSFLLSFISISLNILLVIIIIGILGINTTSFAALLAAGGVAIGMAMSGTLQNFAGGVMILLFKPFKVGEFIEAQGYMGTVKEIKITSTYLTTPDNRLIIVPNGPLSNGIINNFSQTGFRRVEWKISLAYGDDVSSAKQLILDMLAKDERVLDNPAAPFAALDQMADSSIVIVARCWVKTEDFWDLYFEINEAIYSTYPKKGFNFPFPPQLDVFVKKES